MLSVKVTCELCGRPVTEAARTTDRRLICDPCLRAAALWPVSKGRKGGSLYPPSGGTV